MNPSQPAALAARSCKGMLFAVSATIGMADVLDADLSSRVKSSPSIPGRPMSIRIRAGLRLARSSRASSAELRPSTSKPSASSATVASIKLLGSSSTIRIRCFLAINARPLRAPTLAAPEILRNLGSERPRVDRLREVAGAACLECPLAGAHHREGGERHHRNVSRSRVALQPSGERQPLHARHLHIHKDQVRGAVRQLLERFFRIAGHLDSIAFALEHGAGEQPVRFVVLDDEDRCGAVHFAGEVVSIAWRKSWSKSVAPVDPRLRIVETCPFSWRMSASVRCLAVRTMIGVDLVLSSARSASTTSKPVTSGIIRSSSTKSGLRDLASSMASFPPRAWMTANPAGSRILCNHSRLAGSSSTTRMRGFSPALRTNLNPFRRLIKSLAGTGLTK